MANSLNFDAHRKKVTRAAPAKKPLALFDQWEAHVRNTLSREVGR